MKSSDDALSMWIEEAVAICRAVGVGEEGSRREPATRQSSGALGGQTWDSLVSSRAEGRRRQGKRERWMVPTCARDLGQVHG